ncbi:MAG: LPS export ABC transporter permease LptF [Chromatiales bacterium]|nr:LPS export ABC transporter permease LptF [Chromatiales bacterium]
MMRILDRYLFREGLTAFSGALAVLLVLLGTNQCVRILSAAASQDLPRDAVLPMIGYTCLQYLPVIMPAALFFGLLLAIGRMYRDCELPVIRACGYGARSQLKPVLALALPVAALACWMTLDLAPGARRAVDELEREAASMGDLRRLEPGHFVSMGGQGVVYSEEADEQGRLYRVFAHRRVDGRMQVIVTDRMALQETADPLVRMVTFYDGVLYDGWPGEAQIRIVRFAEHGIPAILPETVSAGMNMDAAPSAELWSKGDPESLLELQRRLSAPLVLLILAVMALPLSRRLPRQSRFASLPWALLVYVIYTNLVTAALSWAQQGITPLWLGVWWVHLLLACAAAAYFGMGDSHLIRQFGRRIRAMQTA